MKKLKNQHFFIFYVCVLTDAAQTWLSDHFLQEIQDLDEAQEQAAANQGALELRLNRALEEVERTKTQLSKMKQIHQVNSD